MARTEKGRPPDYRLKAFNKKTEKTTTIGAAWVQDNGGGITLVLDPFVVLRQRADYSFHLFPADPPARKKEATDG